MSKQKERGERVGGRGRVEGRGRVGKRNRGAAGWRWDECVQEHLSLSHLYLRIHGEYDYQYSIRVIKILLSALEVITEIYNYLHLVLGTGGYGE